MTGIDTSTIYPSSLATTAPKVDTPSENSFSDTLQQAVTQSASSSTESAITDSAVQSSIQPQSTITPITLEATANNSFLVADGVADLSCKPCMLEFMNATGTDAQTASDVLYGTIGSNQDLRDWKAIMSSVDPLKSARMSTGAMYNSNLDYSAIATTSEILIADDTVAVSEPTTDAVPELPKIETSTLQAGNFAHIETSILDAATEEPIITSSYFALVDGKGNVLTSVSDPISLAKQASNFGFDLSKLSDLESKLNDNGIDWKSGLWSSGLQVPQKDTLLQALLSL